MFPEYQALEKNDDTVFEEVSVLLLRILNNVLKDPSNPKYRKLRLAHETVSNKLLPAIGAMECLFLFGFQESDEDLVLPVNISLTKLKHYRDELVKCLDNRVKKTESTESKYPKVPPRRQLGNRISYLEEIVYFSLLVVQFEDKHLQMLARSKMPIDQFQKRLKDGENEENKFEQEFGLLFELVTWFKEEFFQWLDSPKCKNCNVSAIFQGHSTDSEELKDANSVEIYECSKCGRRFLCPRHNNAMLLLDTRIGRCEEWANCFMLFCRTLGYDARFVVDKTDHVWTEVYSKSLKRWVHCDPSEGAVDTPLMYEKGWKKKLSYIIAFSHEEVQDVTWRYTASPKEVRARRRLCHENQLLELILRLSKEQQASLSEERRKYLLERRLYECVEFLSPPQSNTEYGGRISGSLQWRLSRKECEGKANQYVWKPNDVEKERKKFFLRFSNSQNEYYRVESDERVTGWQNGIYELETVFRKVERDWKMCYLCRTEESSKGSIKWRISFENSGLFVDKVRVRFQTTKFDTGSIRVILCSDETCIPLDADEGAIDTDSFKGSENLSISAMLSGGKGDHAWQHAQLFRQPIDCNDYPFEIEVSLCSTT